VDVIFDSLLISFPIIEDFKLFFGQSRLYVSRSVIPHVILIFLNNWLLLFGSVLFWLLLLSRLLGFELLTVGISRSLREILVAVAASLGPLLGFIVVLHYYNKN